MHEAKAKNIDSIYYEKPQNDISLEINSNLPNYVPRNLTKLRQPLRDVWLPSIMYTQSAEKVSTIFLDPCDIGETGTETERKQAMPSGRLNSPRFLRFLRFLRFVSSPSSALFLFFLRTSLGRYCFSICMLLHHN